MTKTAYQIITEVMHEVQGVAKKDKNTAQGFSFRGIDAVLNAVGPALRKAGGFIVPTVNHATYSTAQTAKGGIMNVVRLEVGYTVYGEADSLVFGSVAAEAFDSGDKATAKAMSVAFRTFLLQLLALPTDEPDPDSFSYEAVAAKPANHPAQYYLDLAATTEDVEDLRTLYAEAASDNQPASVLEFITNRATKK